MSRAVANYHYFTLCSKHIPRQKWFKNQGFPGFPGGGVVKNLPANAGDRFNPWSEKIPHALKQLNVCATTLKPVLQRLRPQLLNPRTATNKACVLQNPRSTREATAIRSLCTTPGEQPPFAAAREKPVQQQRPSTTKSK